MGGVLLPSSFPSFVPTADEWDTLEMILDVVERRSPDEPFLLDEVVLASLERFEREVGFGLEACRTAVSLTNEAVAMFLRVRDALGLVALLWQIHVHPEDIVLTGAQYESSSSGS